ncbi:MAG TPA: aryl-sulfate sulfotransferase [Candidatus Marinimicrobia bacterium]|nr:aryl-sulfate sulfotransferase [Candidatus Neomarinimicrobiota bacterium]
MILKHRKYIICFILHLFLHGEVFDGYTLFTPKSAQEDGASTHLMNNDYEILHSWYHEYGPASMPYLLPDSSIIYPYRAPNPTMDAGGVGGGIEKQSWDGEILWDFTFSDGNYQHHHDVEPLPSGNILIIVWEKKTAQEAYDMGRETISNPLNQMWSTAILELEPESGEIVWQWHLWDHLIQDFNPDLPGYGVISEHPELMDINCGTVGNDTGGPQGANGDWMHINAVNYNPELDQIVISSRGQDEIFILDHSTTLDEAAGHVGGNSGKGGDFLYRWGNPANYGRGDESDKILNDQHSINWIPPGYPGEGNLILFNNFHEDSQSAVLELSAPLEDGNYILDGSEPYGPETWEWMYMGDITTPMQGGAFRLENGNTLITQCHTSTIVEVDMDGNVVWQYQYESGIGSSWIARAQKYSPDYLMDITLGDLNGDEILNILDIVVLTNLILSGDESNQAGDLNQDGYYNILDIVILVNLILYT